MTRAAMFCDHANEVPMSCPCDSECYCKEHTCRSTASHFEIIHRRKFAVYPGDSLKTDAKPSSMYWLSSGKIVDVLRPRAEDVDFNDIANGLARVQRFGGQINAEHYSVAEHSVLVSRLCSPRNALLGLMHDASEAYIGDVVTPLKRQIPDYRAVEDRWMLSIGIALGVGSALVHLPIDVKVADARALQTERRDLYTPPRRDESGIEPASWEVKGLRPRAAEKLFRKRFHDLTGVEFIQPRRAW